MKIWVVGVADCEGNSITAICSTKEIAERELFKTRDDLVKEWKEMQEYFNKEGRQDKMYSGMIEALSSNNYENWGNYPHDCPYLYETEVIEK